MLKIVSLITSITILINAIAYVFWVGSESFWRLALAILAIILSVLIWVGIWKFRKQDLANFVEGWEIGKGFDLEDPENPKLVNLTIDQNALNLGVLVIGGPGSGKSIMAAGLIEHQIKFLPNNGLAYFCGKGDFDIYQTHVTCGAKPDYFFSSELEDSDTINVMDAPSDTLIDMFSRIFVGSESEFYGGEQKSALRSVIPLMKAFDTPCSLPDLWAILTVPQAGRDLLARARSSNIDADIIASAEQYLSEDIEERFKCIKGLLNKLHPFVMGTVSKRINSYKPTLDITKAVEQGKRLYFHLPLSDTALSVATMITEKIGVIAKDRQLDTQNRREVFPLCFDDWGKFFYSNFGPITARCRTAKMPISFFFQSRGQTDGVEIGKIFTTEITDNIGGMISLRINGYETAEWMAKQFGTYETSAMSLRAIDEQSTTTVEKPRVRADELRDLDAGEAYIQMYVTGEGGKTANKRYKARFPLPSQVNTPPTDWPKIEINEDNNDLEGLHLWRDYMNADRRTEMEREAILNALANEPEPTEEDEEEEIEF